MDSNEHSNPRNQANGLIEPSLDARFDDRWLKPVA